MSNTSRSSFVASFIRHRRTQSQPQPQTFSIDPTSSTSSFDRDARRVQTDERSDNVGAALGNVRAILEASASALDLAPIPGLSAAASALASFIGVIEVCEYHFTTFTSNFLNISGSKPERMMMYEINSLVILPHYAT